MHMWKRVWPKVITAALHAIATDWKQSKGSPIGDVLYKWLHIPVMEDNVAIETNGEKALCMEQSLRG